MFVRLRQVSGKGKEEDSGGFSSRPVCDIWFLFFIIKAIAGGAGGGLGNRSRDEFVKVPR